MTLTEYRIDDLARAAGTTVRNVRAYQDRGLLPPPRREGRVGMYSEAHLARLRVINQLLDRGYSLANIAELVAGWERGHDLGDLLGLADAIATPFADETPIEVPAEEVLRAFAVDADLAAQALRLGLVELDGDRLRVPSPRLLDAGVELFQAGVPFQALLDELERVQGDVDGIADRFVELVATHVFGEFGDDLPPAEAIPELARLVRRIRPLADSVVSAALAAALDRHVRARLGERLDRLAAEAGADEAAG